MKALLRTVGILLLALSFFVVIVGGMGGEMAQPNEVQVGIITNGNFYETDRGYIGGNSEMESEMGAMKGIGYIGCVVGAAMLLVSFMIKKTEPQY